MVLYLAEMQVKGSRGGGVTSGMDRSAVRMRYTQYWKRKCSFPILSVPHNHRCPRFQFIKVLVLCCCRVLPHFSQSCQGQSPLPLALFPSLPPYPFILSPSDSSRILFISYLRTLTEGKILEDHDRKQIIFRRGK